MSIAPRLPLQGSGLELLCVSGAAGVCSVWLKSPFTHTHFLIPFSLSFFSAFWRKKIVSCLWRRTHTFDSGVWNSEAGGRQVRQAGLYFFTEAKPGSWVYR